MKRFSLLILTLILLADSIIAQDTIPEVSLGNDTTICLGEYLVLSPFLPLSCNAEYLWNDGSEEPEKIITKPGIYWVDIQSSCGSTSDTIQIDFTSCHTGCASLNSIAGIYSSPNSDLRGKSLVATIENDGFYVSGTKDDSIFISKVDLSGNILWTRTLEIIPGGKHYVNAIAIDFDGNIAIAGTFNRDFSGTSTSFLLRYDPKSNIILWAMEYQVENFSSCLSMIQNPFNGNYLISHDTGDFLGTVHGGSILEVNKNTGNVIRVISKDETILHDIAVKGNFIYGAGGHKISSENFPRQTLIKLNATDGTVEWAKAGEPYAQVGNVYAPDLLITDTEIYSIYSDVNFKLHIQKTKLNGELIWLKQYEIPGRHVYANEIIKSEKGYVVYAQIYDTQELVMFEIDSEGNMEWARTYYTLTNFFTTQASDAVNQIIEVANEFVFTSFSVDSTDILSNPFPNMIIGRTNPVGNIVSSCINQRSISVQVNEIANPNFFSVFPGDLDFSAETHSFTPEINESKIIPRESCFMYDTIFTYYNSSICEGELFEGYGMPGLYMDTFLTKSGCDSIRVLVLTSASDIHSGLEISICNGSHFEGYTISGIYVDTFELKSGCDSIRTLYLNVISCLPIIYYDLNACHSDMLLGSHMDYSEFIPSYPNSLSCGDISAQFVYRSSPQENKHSCTPGINWTSAMCVSASNSCNYEPNNSSPIVIEFTMNPSADSVIQISGFEFFEKGPTTYNWTNGPSGPNNYPQYYAIRIFKNGIVVFERSTNSTSMDWSIQSYDFLNDDLFTIDSSANFRIELSPYCPVGNGADVSVWDIDEIKVFGGCVTPHLKNPLIKGEVLTKIEQPIRGVEMQLSLTPTFTESNDEITDEFGSYTFRDLEVGNSYFVKGYKNDGVLNGVSTLDIIQIQRHLLGIAPFTSLHQFIAADINKSGNVGATDLLDLRKLILGIYSEFPHNTSWRFGSLPQNMNTSEISLFRETAEIEYLENISQSFDFVGIKVGDLSGDVQLLMQSPVSRSRKSESFKLLIESSQVMASGLVKLEFVANSELNLMGIQFALDLSGTEILSFNGEAVPIGFDNYSIIDGKFRFSWNSDKVIQIASGDVLFSIMLNPSSDKFDIRRIINCTGVMRPEIYRENMEVMDLNLEIIHSVLNLTDVNYLMIEPNPVYSNTNIHFYTQEGGLIECRFFDSSGSLLRRFQKRYLPGEFTEEVNVNGFYPFNGILYCQLISNGSIITKRFVKLN